MGYLFSAYETTRSKVMDVSLRPIIAGQYLICTDTGDVFYDTEDGVRKHLTDIIELETEAERQAILAPINKFYFVKTTGSLWKYNNGTWLHWASGGGMSSSDVIISPTQPTGQEINGRWLEVLS